jgi:lysophospholipase L1-like esterase
MHSEQVILMGDRQLAHFKRSAARSVRFALSSSKLRPLLTWCLIALSLNVLLLGITVALLIKDLQVSPVSASYAWPLERPSIPSSADSQVSQILPVSGSPVSGPRHQLTYEEWVMLLEQEARAIAQDPPDHLAILLGDSLSLWFPHHLLPLGQTWLNQGISGEHSTGLLRRLDHIRGTQPEVIFVMIGINDLLRGTADETLLTNHSTILQNLRTMHPQTPIVLQSILPHAGEQATWEARDRLLDIPNRRIQALNSNLASIAHQQGAYYLDLYPLFSDDQGNLRTDLSTDGLHLNEQGYLVWRSALLMHQKFVLSSTTDP